MTILVLLIVLGSIGGLLAGLLGVGGGLIFIPVLTYLFRLFPEITTEESVRFTLANSIALVFAAGISGIYRQIKMGTYKLKESLYIGIPGAIAASSISYFIQHHSIYKKEHYTVVFLAFLLLSIFNMALKKDTPELPHKTSPKTINTVKASAVGIFAGSVVAISGLGGGIVMVPLFRMILKLTTKQATSLSLSIVPLLSIVPIIQYGLLSPAPTLSTSSITLMTPIPLLQYHYLIASFFIPMALGVVFFSSFGQKIAAKTSASTIRFIFALLSIIILIKTLYELY
jgi:uncharacterized protein